LTGKHLNQAKQWRQNNKRYNHSRSNCGEPNGITRY